MPGLVGRARVRRRWRTPHWLLIALAPGFRYDIGRGAYILRVVGDGFGPVLKDRRGSRGMLG